jgi:chromosome segregation ATPase
MLEETKMSMEQWLFEETVKLEHGKRLCEEQSERLKQEKRECDEERRRLEKEQRRIKSAEDQLKRDQSLFDKKWELLKEEVAKLASDKQDFERYRKFHERVNEYQNSQSEPLKGEHFFKGVTTEEGVRKRYKALLKIYHPDNIDGDSATLMEINKEYDRLSRMF